MTDHDKECDVESDALSMVMDSLIVEYVRSESDSGEALVGAVMSEVANVKRHGQRIFWGNALALAASIAVIAGVWWVKEGRSPSLVESTGGRLVAKVDDLGGSAVVGQAEIISLGGKKRSLKFGDRIFDGDRIETGDKGKVVLAYVDNVAEVTLLAGSTFNVQSSKSEERSKLLEGRLIAEVSKQTKDHPFLVETPQSLVTVLGTRFTMKVIEEFLTTSSRRGKGGATRLDMDEGLVKFTRLSDGKSIDVAAGQYAIAADGVELVAVDKIQSGYRLGSIIFEDDFDNGLGNWELLVGNDMDSLLPIGDDADSVLMFCERNMKTMAGFLSDPPYDVAIIRFPMSVSKGRVICLRLKKPVSEEAFSVKFFVGNDMAHRSESGYAVFPMSDMLKEELNDGLVDGLHPISYSMRWDCVRAGNAADGTPLFKTRRFMQSSFKPMFHDEKLYRTRIVACADRRIGVAFDFGSMTLVRVEVRRLLKK